MHDRGISILEKYDLEASAASRGRGALICQTAGACFNQRVLRFNKKIRISERNYLKNFRSKRNSCRYTKTK